MLVLETTWERQQEGLKSVYAQTGGGSEIEGVDEVALRSGSRLNRVVRARKALCQLAVRKIGYPGAKVARFLGVTTSAVNRAAALEEPVAHRGAD